MKREGGCFCDEVRYRLSAPPMFVQCCHCRDCQKQTGGAFAINGLIEAANVRLLKGKPVRVVMPTDSGRPHDIYRCPKCQTALWSDYGRRGYLLFLRVATLDTPLAPDLHIFTRSKMPWVKLPTGASARAGATKKASARAGATTKKPARAFKVYYDMKKEWPAASLARREKMMAGQAAAAPRVRKSGKNAASNPSSGRNATTR